MLINYFFCTSKSPSESVNDIKKITVHYLEKFLNILICISPAQNPNGLYNQTIKLILSVD